MSDIRLTFGLDTGGVQDGAGKGADALNELGAAADQTAAKLDAASAKAQSAGSALSGAYQATASAAEASAAAYDASAEAQQAAANAAIAASQAQERFAASADSYTQALGLESFQLVELADQLQAVGVRADQLVPIFQAVGGISQQTGVQAGTLASLLASIGASTPKPVTDFTDALALLAQQLKATTGSGAETGDILNRLAAQSEIAGGPTLELRAAIQAAADADVELKANAALAAEGMDAQTSAAKQLALVIERIVAAQRGQGAAAADTAAKQNAAAAAIRNTGTAAANGYRPTYLVGTALSRLAFESVGVHEGFSRVAYSLTSVATSGAQAIAILAVLAALGFAYEALTADARKAQEQIDKTTDALHRQRVESEQSPVATVSTVQEKRQQLAEKQGQLEQAQASTSPDEETAANSSIVQAIQDAQIRKLKEEIAALDKDITFGEKEILKAKVDQLGKLTQQVTQTINLGLATADTYAIQQRTLAAIADLEHNNLLTAGQRVQLETDTHTIQRAGLDFVKARNALEIQGLQNDLARAKQSGDLVAITAAQAALTSAEIANRLTGEEHLSKAQRDRLAAQTREADAIRQAGEARKATAALEEGGLRVTVEAAKATGDKAAIEQAEDALLRQQLQTRLQGEASLTGTQKAQLVLQQLALTAIARQTAERRAAASLAVDGLKNDVEAAKLTGDRVTILEAEDALITKQIAVRLQAETALSDEQKKQLANEIRRTAEIQKQSQLLQAQNANRTLQADVNVARAAATQNPLAELQAKQAQLEEELSQWRQANAELDDATKSRYEALRREKFALDTVAPAYAAYLGQLAAVADAILQAGQTLGVLDDNAVKAGEGVLAAGKALLALTSGASLLSQLPGLIGGIANIVSGLFGGASAERERLRQARAEFEKAEAAFVKIGQAATQFDQAVQSLNDDFQSLVHAAINASGIVKVADYVNLTVEQIQELIASLEKLAAQGGKYADSERKTAEDLKRVLAEREAAEKRLAAQQALELARLGEDLKVRALAASGHQAEADALKLEYDQQRELADLKAKYGGALKQELVDELRHTQALEKEALAQRQAAEAAQKAADAIQTEASIEERELRRSGQNQAADIVKAQADAAKQLADAKAALARGDIDTSQYNRLVSLIDNDLATAIGSITKQYQAQADAAALVQKRLGEDLAVRALEAKGLTQEAEDRKLQLQQQRELEDAIAAGTSAANIARLQEVQALERQAFEQKKVNDAILAAEKILQAEAAIRDDLRVRAARALGQNQLADDLERAQRQQKEIKDALAQGVGQAVLDEIKRVQGLENARVQQDRAADAAKAAEDARAAAAPKLESVAELRNLSAAQGDSMISLLATIETNTRYLRYQNVRTVVVNQSTSTASNPDRDLGNANLRAASAAGFRPAV